MNSDGMKAVSMDRGVPPRLGRPEVRIELDSPSADLLMLIRLGVTRYSAFLQSESDTARERIHEIHEDMWADIQP